MIRLIRWMLGYKRYTMYCNSTGTKVSSYTRKSGTKVSGYTREIKPIECGFKYVKNGVL